MSVNTLLLVFLSAHYFIYPLELLFIGTHSAVGIGTLCLLLIYITLLLGMAYFAKNKYQPFTYCILYLSILWIVIRTHTFILMPNSINYQYLLNITSTEVNKTLIVIILSTGFLYLGTLYANKLFNNKKLSDTVTVDPQKNFFFKHHTFLYGINIFYLILNIVFSSASQTNPLLAKLLGFITMVFAYEITSLLLIAGYIYYWEHLSQSKKRLFWIFIVFFVVARTLMGSKGALFLITSLLAYAYFCFRKFKPIKKQYFVMALISLPLAPLTYILGYILRYVHFAQKNSEASISNFFMYYNKFKHLINLDEVFYSIARRISMLDYLVVMINSTVTKHYFTLGYYLKSTANTLLPGTPFPESTLFSARLFKVNYGFTTFSQIESKYHTDMIPLFGQLHVACGPILLPFIICMIGFLFATSFFYLSKKKTFTYTVASYFVILFFSDIVFGMGIDSTLKQYMFIYPIGYTSLYMIYLCYLTCRKLLSPHPKMMENPAHKRYNS